MIVREAHYIDGEWRRAERAVGIEVVDPFTEEIIGKVPQATEAEIDGAVQAAARALPVWQETPVAERAAALRAIAAGLKSRRDEIAKVIRAELGMPIKQCRDIQLGMPIAILTTTADALEGYAFEETVGNAKVVREPVGVVGCIAPWNYPLHQIAAKIAPALAAGCTVVVKPSEVTPLSGLLLAEVIDACGLPAGVFNLVSGDGPTTGEAIVRHPQVDMVSFTGSTAAGKRVAALAAESVKRAALELGGKSATIVLDDADLDKAIKVSLGAAFLNSGQTCAAQTRLLVPEHRYDEVKAIAAAAIQRWTVGDPREETTRLGPLVSRRQQERVRRYIEEGLASGADVIRGDNDDSGQMGCSVPPVIFGRVDPASRLAQEEVFGPVLAILTYRDEDDAVRIANDSVYGLSGGVWSGDPERAERVARRIRTGQVAINGGAFNIAAPFGGYKQSGIGRENGRFGLEEFLETKALLL
ncbi:aldehyde dehydrogenase family protein [Novosphingobium sp. Gsoil 351]|uniref:aldehyde dehydrogenase family protein n=1 Tax=Novosphingobium sp. Gsoil 351 TaxID=2675225 RepID=UPI0012B49598|nr:aldehyde dehydrogenase family protein [Novosphingobium sp. Gsoil 351]QGN55503.1 aldehyde dehydrogenase family protein [Novosphingobium sp. Gsoil 351]